MTSTDTLAKAIALAAASLPLGARTVLEGALRSGVSDAEVVGAVPTAQYRQTVVELIQLGAQVGVEHSSLALALAASAAQIETRRLQRVSIVWTGPETSSVPVRRTDEALLEVIRRARRRLIVVSFAVYKVRDVADALIAAARRACSVAVVLESANDRGGNTFEMAAALGSDVAEHVTYYTWPIDQRPNTGAGRPASLHAKCAVADDALLLVSSANLTEYAFTKNMELGLLVEGGDLPARVGAHLEELIATGVLRSAT